MSGYDNWDDERERLLNAVDESERERVSDLIDRAASSARTNGLREAAHWLEETRRALVGNNLFRNWDNGIWVFSSLIRLIRAMSAETPVPQDYQRFLDAIPSASYEARMSPAQTEFWYGSVAAPVYSDIRVVARERAEPPSSSGGVLWIVGILIAIAIAAYLFFR